MKTRMREAHLNAGMTNGSLSVVQSMAVSFSPFGGWLQVEVHGAHVANVIDGLIFGAILIGVHR